MKAVILFLGFAIFLGACATPLAQINGDRRTGQVILQVEPADAEVYLDGQDIGRASRFDGTKGALAVALGGHVLKFTADDFENELREVLAKETPQTLVVKMLPRPKPATQK